MRISDWSSDVCSSDLCQHNLPPEARVGVRTVAGAAICGKKKHSAEFTATGPAKGNYAVSICDRPKHNNNDHAASVYGETRRDCWVAPIRAPTPGAAATAAATAGSSPCCPGPRALAGPG